ncbi:MAG: hypothetical protein JO154_04085 [Chitinophaga sp.]|uniref:hypothetical protein n=1 Tax=Chitinophaga sp. TaxID=1869181 RepID=UPI0025BBE73E|nr:hypothetical protein [Chitinophaga sp.]MBV8251765.1 hypothetical protein [Chitinophaga sp.]
MKINDYINSFVFDYFETYSYNREEQEGKYTGSDLLIDRTGEWHATAERKAVYEAGNQQVIIAILNRPEDFVLRFLCAPYYRDAIVFYNKTGEIVSVLNVCLSCCHMTDGKQDIEADYLIYDDLKRFFIACGHEVESPDKFYEDEIRKMRKK